ncbi:MAG: Fe-S cluster assembly protein SufD, partial [Microvirga sp.]
MNAELKVIRTAAEQALIQRFPALRDTLPHGGIVKPLRDAAYDLLVRRGLPHRRVEEWKYTDLRALMREAAPLAEKPSAEEIAVALSAARAFADADVGRLTFVNGHFAPGASDHELPAGLEVVPLAEALAAGHPLVAEIGAIGPARDNAAYAINTAFMSDGAVIRIAAGAALARPLHLRFVTSAPAAVSTATRVLVVVEEGASLTLVESH